MFYGVRRSAHGETSGVRFTRVVFKAEFRELIEVSLESCLNMNSALANGVEWFLGGSIASAKNA
jgi:hypothetical protein